MLRFFGGKASIFVRLARGLSDGIVAGLLERCESGSMDISCCDRANSALKALLPNTSCDPLAHCPFRQLVGHKSTPTRGNSQGNSVGYLQIRGNKEWNRNQDTQHARQVAVVETISGVGCTWSKSGCRGGGDHSCRRKRGGGGGCCNTNGVRARKCG